MTCPRMIDSDVGILMQRMGILCLLGLSLSAAGCTAMLREVSAAPAPNYVVLTYRAVQTPETRGTWSEVGDADGIFRVDATEFRTPMRQVYVARGNRRIWFGCPAWDAFDDVWISQRFETGKRYELVCELDGSSAIHEFPLQ